MKFTYFLFTLVIGISGCVNSVEAPIWNPITESAEMEYQPYLEAGNATITGQAFLAQRGGNVVKAAGRTVTLDPATSIGNEWWKKVVTEGYGRSETPPFTAFQQARRTTTADADGRFRFSDLPPGKYYLHTVVTWETGSRYSSTQGGMVGQLVEVQAGEAIEVILSKTASSQSLPR